MNEKTNDSKTNGAPATDGEQAFRPGSKEAALYEAIGEARAIIDRYAPEKGQGVSLNTPSPGEARRFIACIKGLLSALEGPSVESQPVRMLTR